MTPDTLAVFVGGLGGNQWTQGTPMPIEQVQAACPNALCTHLSDCGYIPFGVLPPIIEHIKAVKAITPSIRRVIAIGHSMGWCPIAKAAIEGAADTIVAVDPVGLCGVSHDAWPGVPGIYAKASPTIFITQLRIDDAPFADIYPCGHNELPHDPALIAAIVRLIQETP